VAAAKWRSGEISSGSNSGESLAAKSILNDVAALLPVNALSR